jgi:uncharacterized membrane protein
VSPAQVVFAATLAAFGAIGLVDGDLALVGQPVPEGWAGREALAILCASVSLASGAGLLWRRARAVSAPALLAYLLLWFLLARVSAAVVEPTEAVLWEQFGEAAVMVAGAWVLYAGIATDRDRRLGFAAGEGGVRIARVLYGLAMIAFGAAHFAYVEQTAGLVPAWLPSHTAWVYFTGSTYIAAGAAVLAGVQGRLAASLSALQMGAFTALVWVPVLAAGPQEVSQWSEGLVSWGLTAGGWVVADSYRLQVSRAWWRIGG